jgi:hypothetical protein
MCEEHACMFLKFNSKKVTQFKNGWQTHGWGCKDSQQECKKMTHVKSHWITH